MKVTILGCGGSGGVPSAAGEWGICNPNNPKNRRRRASIAVQTKETTVVVDTSPDLREQCLSTEIQRIDGVIYTHDHADHTHGIDDLKAFARQLTKSVPVYGDLETLSSLQTRFRFAFPIVLNPPDIYYPFLEAHPINGPFHVGDISVIPFAQGHGYSTSMGYRFDKVAYTTDAVTLDDAAFKALEDVEVWIVDCVTMDPRPTHSHLAQTLEWIERVKPRQAYLTHMSSLLDYDTLMDILPKGVEPAYDGLVIEV